MTQLDSPIYVLDFNDQRNWSSINNAQDGKEVIVFVCVQNDRLVPSIQAKGLRKDDVFCITVTTDAGEQTHNWIYDLLIDKLNRLERKGAYK